MDHDPVRRFNAGDVEAFAELYRRHFAEVRAFHLMLLRQEDLAENLTQETFVRVFKAAPHVPDDHFKAWLFKIARHLSIDEFRRRNGRDAVPLESVENFLPSSCSSDPVTMAEEREMRRNITAVLASLPRHHQELILLRDLLGLSYEEIGETLGLSREAVRSALHRARTEFRNRYTDYEMR